MSTTIEDILQVLQRRGHEYYGAEGISQLEHALQCAALAEEAGSGSELIVACLLHDLGHLVHDLGDDPFAEGVDDIHQFLALPFLRPLFGNAVLEPIRLHVEAKRYLCAVDVAYWKTLSFASQRSLELQGGVMTPDQAETFLAKPYASSAIQLRQWDDEAKVAGKRTPDLDHFFEHMVAASRREHELCRN